MKASFASTLLAVALAPGLVASTQVQAVLYVNLDATGLTHDGSKGGGIEAEGCGGDALCPDRQRRPRGPNSRPQHIV